MISRAHLPRLLARLDWMELNLLVELHFGVQVELRVDLATSLWTHLGTYSSTPSFSLS